MTAIAAPTKERIAKQTALSRDCLSLIWDQLLNDRGAPFALQVRALVASFQMAHSYSLLNLAALVAQEDGWQNGSKYFGEHAQEEKGHFSWSMADYAVLADKTSLEEVENRTDDIADYLSDLYSSLLVGRNVSAFVGYVFALEALPAEEDYWMSLLNTAKLPESAARSALRHAVLDRRHSAELLEFIGMAIGDNYLDEKSIVDSANLANLAICKTLQRYI